MHLISIPENEYGNYRQDIIFGGYKWDPQFADSGTIARHALIITQQEHEELENLTEKLTNETERAEMLLLSGFAGDCRVYRFWSLATADSGSKSDTHDSPPNVNVIKALKLPRRIRKELKHMHNYNPDNHVRLMRFDFHPVTDGKWALSEVNSDVPGGFAEASLMPQIAMRYLNKHSYSYVDFSEALTNAITGKINPGGTAAQRKIAQRKIAQRKIALIHCTCYSDDRQVMQFIGDKLENMGYQVIYAAADHLRFEDNKAVSILGGNGGKVDAIIRFTPIEWLVDMKPGRHREWRGYFNTITPSCNHPIAAFAQTKRFPFVWDTLEKHGIDLSAWRELLPETLEVKDAGGKEGFIYKPVWGRVGEGISIAEACRDDEYAMILKDVKRHPGRYVAQKRFESRPLLSDNGESYHVCIGAFSVEGKAAGYYARVSRSPRIDSGAADIPVLIE